MNVKIYRLGKVVQSVFAVFLACVACAAPALPDQQSYRFEWRGANDYALRGALSFDPQALDGPMVLAQHVTCFEIEGVHNGNSLGSWGLVELQPNTSWR